MKNVVVNELGREIEFKPSAILEKYLKLTEKDVKPLFQSAPRAKGCPACGSKRNAKVFSKFGQDYHECRNCSTVFTILRPKDDELKEHYRNSASANFWRETLSLSTAGKRKEKIYAPRLQWIKDLAEEYLSGGGSIGDLNSKNPGYAAELLQEGYFSEKAIINPYYKGKGSAAVKGPFDLLTLFEVLDYTSDPGRLFKAVKNRMRNGGLLFLTTISINGFDLQVLWEHSKSIFPPDRLNAFSRKGLEILADRNGFKIIEYSTPGVLDVDMVRNAMRQEPEQDIPRFVRTMLGREDDQLDRDFQTFLQVNRLSSFVRMVIRKGEK